MIQLTSARLHEMCRIQSRQAGLRQMLLGTDGGIADRSLQMKRN